MKKFIVVSLILIVFCTPLAQAQNGIYVTVASGWSFLNGMPDANDMDASSVKQKNFPAFRGSVGYVHQIFFSPFGVGFEIGKGIYSDYRYQINNSELKANSSTLEFLGVVRLRLPRHNYVYTKLGGIRNTMTVTYQDKTQEKTRIQPMVSLGVTHGLFPHVFLDLSYNVSFGQRIPSFIPVDWKAPTIQTVLVGIGVSFF